MKTKLGVLKLLIILSSTFATTTVFGQTTYTWTNSAGGDLAGSTNWNPNGVPNPTDANVGDTMQFDGQSAGPVAATSNTGAQVGYSGGAWGLKVHLTSNQTSPVNFFTTVANTASPGIRLSDITIDGDAGSFSLGNSSTTNALDTIWGGMAGQTHSWVNKSTNPATICPNARWRFGGGGVHNFVFDGSGNWIVNNYLIQVDGVTSVVKSGSGTMLWTGKNVLYSQGNGYIISPVIINGGTLILKSSDLLNTQNITHNGTLLEYDAPVGACTLSGVISGTGRLVVSAGTLTLTATNTYTGPTTVSNGTLVVNSVGGGIDVNGGTLVAGGVGSVSTLNVGGSMNIDSGTIVASLNKSLSPSNTTFMVTGTVNGTGGTLKLLNFGPNLVVGDKFTLFNQAVTGGAALTIVSPGITVANNLAVDGSVTVTAVAPPGTGIITATVSGGNLNLSWLAAWTGLHLQSQTNPLTIGLSTNWVTIPGTDAGNSYPATLNNSNRCVFYRLAP